MDHEIPFGSEERSVKSPQEGARIDDLETDVEVAGHGGRQGGCKGILWYSEGERWSFAQVPGSGKSHAMLVKYLVVSAVS